MLSGQPAERINVCQPSPCGANAVCQELSGAASCTCSTNFYGNPYEGCRPECLVNTDCGANLACIQTRCQDPCLGRCGQNANCQVVNHLPVCSCSDGFQGDPFRFCSPKTTRKIDIFEFLRTNKSNDFDIHFFLICPATVPSNPCNPSPCGPNSQCRNLNGQASCSCLPTYLGSPPNCKPECTLSSECAMNRACVNNKCIDPCPGVCGTNAECRVFSHSPICSCRNGETGDPFIRCFPANSKEPHFILHFLKIIFSYQRTKLSN